MPSSLIRLVRLLCFFTTTLPPASLQTDHVQAAYAVFDCVVRVLSAVREAQAPDELRRPSQPPSGSSSKSSSITSTRISYSSPSFLLTLPTAALAVLSPRTVTSLIDHDDNKHQTPQLSLATRPDQHIHQDKDEPLTHIRHHQCETLAFCEVLLDDVVLLRRVQSDV